MSEFQQWERRFSGEDYVSGVEPNAFLKSCAPFLHPGQRALAVADGEGRNGVWLASDLASGSGPSASIFGTKPHC